MDDKLLSALGLSTKEVKLFKAVLKSGELSPAELAKAVGIKRTTCYSLARGLAEKGFLLEHAEKRPRTFTLAQPGDLEHVLEEDRRDLAAREKLLKKFSNDLSLATAGESYPVPQIRFVPEEKIEQFLDSQSFKWDESMLKSDGTCWGFQDHTYVEKYSHVIDKYWKRTHKGIHLKMLTNKAIEPAEMRMIKKYPRRQMKFWNKAMNFLCGTWVMGEYILIVNTSRHPFYLTEIHDATLANDLREVFKNLWELI